MGKIAEQYLTTGAKVYIEGQLRTRKWQEPSGVERSITEIHLTPYNGTVTFLDRKKDGTGASGGDRAAREPAMAGACGNVTDGEIPF